ncbi:hypothetical protein H4R33_003133 [Dimargaris cristalligena]|nr:hypothetical protein H4R33_003133 [Dimargaris cristalligena]
MSLIQSQPLELPEQTAAVHMALYSSVINASDLFQRLVARDTSLQMALLNAETIMDPFQIMVAAHRAARAEQLGQLRTHNVHSELVFDLSPNNNIREALTRFGISSGSTHVLAVRVGGSQEQFAQEIAEIVEGRQEPIEQLSKYTNMETVRKSPEDVQHSVIGSMALKGHS